MKKLTDKQGRFCQEFLVDCDASKAAKRAGYSAKTCGEQGFQQLQKTSIQAELRKGFEKKRKRNEVDADWIVQKLIESHKNASEDGSHSASIQALNLLGKNLGMFKDRYDVEISQKRSIESILHEIIDEEEVNEDLEITHSEFG